MRYGDFSPDGKEYIIDHVATPSPWINYLYNGSYFATISNNGGGISYYRSPLHGRVTRYRINDVPPDRPGKYIYVKDRDSGEIWSLTWQPVGRHLEAYRVHHGFGYTRVESRVAEIRGDLLYFVPPGDHLEIWQALLHNESSRVRRLSVYGYVEFALGHALIDLINQCDDQHFNRVHFDPQVRGLFATKTYWVTESRGTQHQENKEWDQWAFFTTNQPVTGFETLRERFIGPYRSETNPLAIEQEKLGCQETDFGNAVGALQVDLELAPGAELPVVFTLGVVAKEAFNTLRTQQPVRYHDARVRQRSWEKLQAKWDRYFQVTRVKTPDATTDVFMNYWTPYQARVAFEVGRVASFYYWGIGRGFGFRDTSQDTIAVTLSDPELARQRILLLSRQMFSDGHVYHHFYGDGQGEVTGHCDDPLWYLLAISDYIKQTGDWAILDNPQPFVDALAAPLLDHLTAVVHFVENNLGRHGLPNFGRGDWNDTLDYIGGDDGGESVWGAMFYVAMLNLLIEILEHQALTALLVRTVAVRDRLREAVQRTCWDGAWYIRAFGARERKIGSKSSKAGKIFLNPQSWAVIAGIDAPARLEQAMQSLWDHLNTPFGPKKCAPAFREIDPTIGLVTRCVAGKKENGAIFAHPTAWVIQAECLLGHGDRAYTYYKEMLPNTIDPDIFVAEPYVFSQYVTSDEHSAPGRASHSWQTGTAAWMYRVMMDYFLGVRATFDGLYIDPVIPSAWEGFTFERVFRGTHYVIQVHNPEGVQRGVRSIHMEGAPVAGHRLPLTDKKRVTVEVVMG
ncbi:MAG TPA: glycosyl transferase family 36 [bacterium]|nr:glycosyl transferase family 36 [bacterium]HNW61198.1 glycosyl transferase family 36 [bacterium]